MVNARQELSQPLAKPLSQREFEVLVLLVEGLSNDEIAERLVVAYTTVKWYVRQVFNKLGVENRVQAINHAQALGLVSGDASAQRIKNNLPAPVTRFVGREHELADLARLLKEERARLITILGPGGMGKTRLALAAAESAAGTKHSVLRMPLFSNGVYFVPLAPLTSPEQIIPAMADAIGFQFAPDRRTPQQQLFYFLRDKHLLLVLDNFEHLLDGATLVTDMLQSALHACVLVVSRERLNLSGETIYALNGLPYPERSGDNPLAYGAVELFVESARRTRPDFALDAEQGGVVQVCRLVQGMPLAIELAAAWVGALSPVEIAEEIRRSVDFLQTRKRDVPERLRSIRAVFESAWARLTGDEQAVFRKLSVFRGGCSREAAQAVTGADTMTLTALVDKALLWRHPESRRFEIHELSRNYAEEKLSEAADDEADTRRLHSRYYAAVLQQMMRHVQAGHLLPDALQRDLDNALEGVLYATRHKLLEEIAGYADGFWEYFESRGWFPVEAGLLPIYRDAIAVVEEAAQQGTAADGLDHLQQVLLRLCESLGMLLYSGRYYDEAKSAFEQALKHSLPEDRITTARLYRQIGNIENAQRAPTENVNSAFRTAEIALGTEPTADASRWWREWIQIQLDVLWVYYLHSEIVMMAELMEKVAVIIEQYGTPIQRSKLLHNRVLLELRRCMFRDVPDSVLDDALAALDAANQAKGVRDLAWLQFTVGFVHLWRDDFEQAEHYFLSALEQVEETGDSMGTLPTAMAYLPVIYRRWQQVDAVAKWAQMAITVAAKAKAVFYHAAGYAHLGWVYRRQGALAEAQQACEAALALWSALVVPYPFRWFADAPLLAIALDRDQVEQAISHARALLDPRLQQLTGELPDLLSRAVQAWEENNTASARDLLAAFCTRSASLGFV